VRENPAKTSNTINAAHQAKKRRSSCLSEAFVRTRFSLAGADASYNSYEPDGQIGLDQGFLVTSGHALSGI
jgi:hypothetical protein